MATDAISELLKKGVIDDAYTLVPEQPDRNENVSQRLNMNGAKTMRDSPATNEETKTLRMSKHIQGDLENQKFICFVF